MKTKKALFGILSITATNTSMVYPQYWDVDNWGELFSTYKWLRNEPHTALPP